MAVLSLTRAASCAQEPIKLCPYDAPNLGREGGNNSGNGLKQISDENQEPDQDERNKLAPVESNELETQMLQ